jgi:hypothetical protein
MACPERRPQVRSQRGDGGDTRQAVLGVVGQEASRATPHNETWEVAGRRRCRPQTVPTEDGRARTCQVLTAFGCGKSRRTTLVTVYASITLERTLKTA